MILSKLLDVSLLKVLVDVLVGTVSLLPHPVNTTAHPFFVTV
jgi:hypothetical protein